MKIFYKILWVSLLGLCACTRVPTQQQVSKKQFSDEELKKFASIYDYLRLRPRENSEMVVRDAVLKSSLSEKRFGEIMRAKFTQQKIDISASEQQVLDKIRNVVKNAQLSQKKKDEREIIKRGLTLERYYAILRAYKQSTFLQNRVYDLTQAKKD